MKVTAAFTLAFYIFIPQTMRLSIYGKSKKHLLFLSNSGIFVVAKSTSGKMLEALNIFYGRAKNDSEVTIRSFFSYRSYVVSVGVASVYILVAAVYFEIDSVWSGVGIDENLSFKEYKAEEWEIIQSFILEIISRVSGFFLVSIIFIYIYKYFSHKLIRFLLIFIFIFINFYYLPTVYIPDQSSINVVLPTTNPVYDNIFGEYGIDLGLSFGFTIHYRSLTVIAASIVVVINACVLVLYMGPIFGLVLCCLAILMSPLAVFHYPFNIPEYLFYAHVWYSREAVDFFSGSEWGDNSYGVLNYFRVSLIMLLPIANGFVDLISVNISRILFYKMQMSSNIIHYLLLIICDIFAAIFMLVLILSIVLVGGTVMDSLLVYYGRDVGYLDFLIRDISDLICDGRPDYSCDEYVPMTEEFHGGYYHVHDCSEYECSSPDQRVFWFTIMYLSTLIPTALHALFVVFEMFIFYINYPISFISSTLLKRISENKKETILNFHFYDHHIFTLILASFFGLMVIIFDAIMWNH